MTSRRRAAPGPLRLLTALRDVLLILGVAASFGGAQGVDAQSTQAQLAQRRVAYTAAKAEYDRVRSAFGAVNQPFTNAIAKVARAKASRDSEALQRAYRETHDLAVRLDAEEQRLRRVEAVLDSTRQALIDVIGKREGELVDQMSSAPDTHTRDSLNTRYVDLNSELHTLEVEAGRSSGLQPTVGLLVDPDPRDGPEDFRLKAGILERFAAQADTTIQQTDQTIKDLQARLRSQQIRADVMAGLNRFDDTRLPVVTNAPPGEPGTAADSTGAGARPLTLQERIKGLQDYRKQLVSYRDKAIERAREFRRRAGGSE